MNKTNKTVFFGRKKISINEKRKNITKIFADISNKYDKMNDIMSLGTHRLWKKDLVDRIGYNLPNHKNSQILDIAGGTGDISIEILKKYPNNNITILDLTTEMIKIGKSKAALQKINNKPLWIVGDSAKLPLQNSIYDIITCAFGIRNIAEIEKTLNNCYKVLKPGGKLYILEFSPKTIPSFQGIYNFYLKNIIPILGEKFANNRDAYQYLIESIETFYTPDIFIKKLKDANFKMIKLKNYFGGIACLYIAIKI